VANDSIQLPIEVTGDAEARIKKITDAVMKLESKGGDSLDLFGEAAHKAFEVFTEIATVVAFGEAIHKSLDLVFEAETIRSINAQFEILSRNAGISGNALKEGLAKAADGLVDDTDLIKVANQAIVEMGASAAKLPPIMDLARKATAVFGGDLVHNFEALEHAISTGQTRALKQFGIVVDSERAYKAFAASVGTTADVLSQAGKQQAILNAVLSEGNKQFNGVDVNLKQATDSYQRIKATMSQVGEVATLAFEKLAGPAVHALLNSLNELAAKSKVALTASFGEGAEKAQANVDQITTRLKELNAQLDLAKAKHDGKALDFTPGDTVSQLQALPKTIADYQAKLVTANAELSKFKETNTGTAESAKSATTSYIDLAAAQAKLVEEGKRVSDHLAGEDPNAKYEKDLAALTAYIASKQEITDADSEHLDQLETDRDAKLQEQRQKELDDLNSKNDSLKALNADLYAGEIAANQAKIDQIIAQEGAGSKLYLLQKKKEHDAEIQIKLATANSVSGILGNMAVVARQFGEEGFAVYQALAKAQALVNTYSSAVGAYNSAVAIPIVGPVLAPIAAAAAVAAGLANVAAINATHLATGIDEVPPGFSGDNFPAFLQTGERVVPKDTNKDLKGFLAGDGPMIALLESIDSKLSRLSTVVNIDGREVFNSMRSQLQSGRAFS
jgi:hypothetical protein